MKNIATIILAAGKGTRMKSEHPKVIFPLAEKPMIRRVCQTAINSGSTKNVIVVGYKKDEVIKSLNTFADLEFVEQNEQLGTGHAVICCKEIFEYFTGDIFILAGDVPLLKSDTLRLLLNIHKDQKASCTVLTAVLEDAGKYGRIIRDEKDNFRRIVEYKDATDQEREIREFNTGIYCFRANDLFSALDKINCNNNQREYYLTDTLEILLNEKKQISTVLLDDIKEASGVNSQRQLAELEDLFYEEVRNYWLDNGVTIENPLSVIIGEDVAIGRDTTIAANTIIKGKTKIGTDCFIGPNCFLQDAEIENNCILRGYNLVVNSTLHNDGILDYEKSI